MTTVFFSRVTPPGRGAIAIVRVWGEGCAALVQSRFESRFSKGGGCSERVRYGRFHDEAGDTVDDGLVVPIPGEEESYFITLHGNPVLVNRWCEVLRSAGAEESAEGKSLCEQVDPIALEARGLLPRALSPEAAAFLLEQGEGSLGFARWRVELEERRASMPELEQLLVHSKAGRGLSDPPRVVLAGVPNAGKSTLFNQLVGRRRVLTDPAPGTTRDVVEELILMGPYAVRLVDGAGIRSTAQEIEAEGVRRIRSAVTQCDLVVLLSPPPSVASEESVRETRDEVRRLQSSVIELCSHRDETSADGEPGGVSGLTGVGVPELEDQILRTLFGSPTLPRGVPVPFLPRHVSILEAALAVARAGKDPGPILLGL